MPLLRAIAEFIAQVDAPPPAQRLDPQTQVKLLAALAGFIILGVGLVALTWLGARVTRRYMNQSPIRRRDWKTHQDDWASTPLHRPEGAAPRDEDE